MAEIRVELRDFTDGILGNLDITSSDDFPLSLTYQNFDIRDFNSRNGSFSKTFKVPATKSNNVLFNHIYEEGHTLNKDVIKNIPSIIYCDNLPIITGSLRLTKITKSESVLEYECIFLGDNMDWANSIKEKELKDLTFSPILYTNYPPSNTTYVFENPHGFDGDTANQNPYSHEQYVKNHDKLIYPLLSVGEGDSPKSQVVESDFVPCVYVKNVWDKIFQSEGYNVESTFCDSDFFKSLIMPLIFEKNSEIINTRYGKISLNNDDNLTSEVTGGSFSYGDGNQTLNRAIGNPTYNINNDEAAHKIYYVFGGDSFDDTFNGGTTSTTTGNVINGDSGLTSLLVKNDEGNQELQWDVNVNLFSLTEIDVISDPTLKMRVIGRVAKLTDNDDDSSDVYAAANQIWSDQRDILFAESNSPENMTLNPFLGSYETDNDPVGAKYVFYIQFQLMDYAGSSIGGGDKDGDVGIKYLAGSKFEISDNTEIEINEEIDDISFLLPKGKQSDFVSGLAQMFNLQFETDAISKIVKIEPYDNFYEGFSNAVDWTNKVDYSKDIQEEFLYEMKTNLTLKYKDASNDAFLDRYNKKNFVDWGAYEEVDDTGRYIDGEYKIENKFFSASFNYHEMDYVDETNLNVAEGADPNAASAILAPLIPIYHSEFSNLNTKEDRAEKDFDIGARILLLPPALTNGLSAANSQTIMYASEYGIIATGYHYAPLPNNDVDATSLWNNRFARANFINIDNIYYDAGTMAFATLDNGYVDVDLNLSFSDVNYDVPSPLDSTGVKKIRGLYYHYYNKMIKQIKQKPRIKKIYINLSKTDINRLDFKKLVFIDGNYYRINKIIDYKPHIQSSTKVELTEYFILGSDSETQGATMDMINGIDL